MSQIIKSAISALEFQEVCDSIRIVRCRWSGSGLGKSRTALAIRRADALPEELVVVGGNGGPYLAVYNSLSQIYKSSVKSMNPLINSYNVLPYISTLFE